MPQPGKLNKTKRQPPIPLPDRLLAHMRRWHRNGQRYVIEWHRQSVRMDNGFRDAARAAGLDGVTPHILKHTAITWLLQRGVDIWTTAGYTGTSPQTIQRVYGHHAVDHLAAARAAFDRPGRIIPTIPNENEERIVKRTSKNVTKRPIKQRKARK
jgi:integrase